MSQSPQRVISLTAVHRANQPPFGDALKNLPSESPVVIEAALLEELRHADDPCKTLFSSTKYSVYDKAQELAQDEHKWAILNEKIEALQTALGETNASLAATKKELNDTKTELAATKKELNDIKTELAATKKELNDTKTELAAVERRLQDNIGQLSENMTIALETAKQMTEIAINLNKRARLD